MTRKHSKLTDAAAQLRKARKQLSAARAALARDSRVGSPHHLVERSYSWMGAALAKIRARLLAINGVVGVGFGYRVRAGVRMDEPVITVLVTRKQPKAMLKSLGTVAIPKVTRVGKRSVPIDVVEFGALSRQAQTGDDIGPAQGRRAGTLGTLAVDLGDRSTVAITAMHFSGAESVQPGDAPIPFCDPSTLTNASAPVFANLVLGTKNRVDAAKLRLLAPQSSQGFIPGLGPIAGWRPIAFPGDMHTTVQMFGAVSGLQQGFIANTSIDIPSEGLESAILVNIFSQEGDSGSVMVDNQRFVLGFLVGAGDAQLGNLRVFCPAGLVLSELNCDIP